MRRDEAAKIVAYLNAAFPRDALEGEALALFESEVGLLADHSTAMEAARRHAHAEVHFPSIAAFRQTYRAVARDREPAREAIPETSGETPVPMTPDGWEALGRRHRELRASEFPSTVDPAAGAPLPRNRAQFNAEWSKFLVARFSDDELVRSMA